MSQENVEVVRRLFDAYAAGGVEAALSFFAPSVVLHPYPEWPGPSEYRGHDGIRALMAEWTENFDDFEMEVHEIREVEDRVLLLAETVGRIKGSGVPIREPFEPVTRAVAPLRNREVAGSSPASSTPLDSAWRCGIRGFAL